jgi:cell division protein FtsB
MKQMQPGQLTSSWRSLIRWPAFLIANLALLFVVGASTIRETYRGWSIDREIRTLEAQAAALEGQKLQLDGLVKDLASEERIEYEARARLGKKKAGERVIVLEGFAPTGTWTQDSFVDLAPHPSPERSESNPQRWWSYFIHSQRP